MSHLDLHGMTIHSAWKAYRSTTQDCYLNKIKKLTIVTGHGIMSAEFQGWVSADPFALTCERQNPNTGAWVVKIKKNSHIKKSNNEATDLTVLYKKFKSK